MTKLEKVVDFTGQNIYVGLDVHAVNWNVTAYSDHLFLKTFHMESDPYRLENYLNSNYPGARVEIAYEAGFSGFWLQRKLEKMNFHCIVVNPGDVPQTNKSSLNKTDNIDSKRIALALRAKQISGIFVPSEKQEDDRLLLRQRFQLVKNLTRTTNMIKSLLYFKGIQIPITYRKHSSKRFISWLKSIEHKEVSSKLALDQKISHLEFLRKELTEVTKHIRLLMKSNSYLQSTEILRSIPGIGEITCFALLTEVGDIKRFVNFKAFNSFVGLCPTERSSGQTEHRGGITPRHNKTLRSLLIETSWTAIRKDPAITKYYSDLLKRMSGKRAIIRVARKLLNRIYQLWIKEIKYENMKMI